MNEGLAQSGRVGDPKTVSKIDPYLSFTPVYSITSALHVLCSQWLFKASSLFDPGVFATGVVVHVNA